MRLALLMSLALAAAAPAAAEIGCSDPPPVFHCGEWRRDDAGRLTSTRPVVAGLIELDAGYYLGDHTVGGGVDYAEELRRQCGR